MNENQWLFYDLQNSLQTALGTNKLSPRPEELLFILDVDRSGGGARFELWLECDAKGIGN